MTHFVRAGLVAMLAFVAPLAVNAAPFAAFVMDARTGKAIHAQNADTRLHPASLTKMMTLYMAFTAIERGQVRLDTKFLVSTNAAAEPPSKLGLKAGQRIELRYLIRAAAVKSANDAATTIGENLAGSEPKFAAQMTAMARALGMNNSNFLNAHGLTSSGHYSSARDMSTLGRRLFYDFPQYYSLFSRRSADAGIATVRSTNRNFLDNYNGADGIKTGYTRAAGFNLTASAQRGSKRIIATVMGGQSTAQRNAIMGQLLDVGFGKAPTRVREIKPAAPQYIAERKSTRKVQVATQVKAVAPLKLASAPRVKPNAPPQAPVRTASIAPVNLSDALRAAMAPAMRPSGIEEQKAAAPVAPSADAVRISARPIARPQRGGQAPAETQVAALAGPAAAASLAASPRPDKAPREDAAQLVSVSTAGSTASGLSLAASPAPKPRSSTIRSNRNAKEEPKGTTIVSRASSSGGSQWGVHLGLFKAKASADQLLLKTALQESDVLDNALRNVRNTNRGFEANFVGLSKGAAELACQKLNAKQQTCRVLGP